MPSLDSNLNARLTLANKREQARTNLLKVNIDSYTALDQALVNNFKPEQATLFNLLNQAEKYFPQEALPPAGDDRDAVIINFLKDQIKKSSSPSQRQQLQSLTPELKEHAQELSMLHESFNVDPNHPLHPLYKKWQHCQHGKSLAQNFQSSQKGAKKWLQDACNTLEKIALCQFVTDRFSAHEKCLQRIETFKQNGLTLTNEDLDQASADLKILNPHLTRNQPEFNEKQTEAQINISSLEQRGAKIPSFNGEAEQSTLNKKIDEVNSQRELLHSALTALKINPFDVQLKQEVKEQKKQLNKAITDLRKKLDGIEKTYAINGYNYTEIMNTLDTLRRAPAVYDKQRPLNNLSNRLGLSGMLGNQKSPQPLQGGINFTTPGTVFVWERTQDGDYKRTPLTDRDGKEIKISLKVALKELEKLQSNEEFKKKFGKFHFNVKSQNGVLLSIYAQFKDDKAKNYFIQRILAPAQEAENKAIMSGKSVDKASVSASLEEKDDEKYDEKYEEKDDEKYDEEKCDEENNNSSRAINGLDIPSSPRHKWRTAEEEEKRQEQKSTHEKGSESSSFNLSAN